MSRWRTTRLRRAVSPTLGLMGGTYRRTRVSIGFDAACLNVPLHRDVEGEDPSPGRGEIPVRSFGHSLGRGKAS
jgi:hypothetical protein